MTDTTPDVRTGVPLAWTGETGYRCPACSLFVAVSRRTWATCPRCPSIPVEETSDLLLAEATGFDESERAEVVEALGVLLRATTPAAIEAAEHQAPPTPAPLERPETWQAGDQVAPPLTRDAGGYWWDANGDRFYSDDDLPANVQVVHLADRPRTAADEAAEVLRAVGWDEGRIAAALGGGPRG